MPRGSSTDYGLEVSLEGALGPMLVVQSSQEIRFNCPFCAPDHDWHLYVGYRKGRGWICQRCRTAGRSIDSLLAKLGLRKETDVSLYDDVRSTVENLFASPVDAGKPAFEEFVPLPDGFTELPAAPNPRRRELFYAYLERRGVPRETADIYRVGLSDESFWMTRVIFPDPSAMDATRGLTSHWVARTILNEEPKYLNPPGPFARYRVFTSRWKRDRCIVVEGVLDAIRTGRDAVCLYGKQCSSYQLDILLSLGVSSYYVALDPDAIPWSLTLCENLSLAGRRVFFVSLPKGEDPGTLGPRMEGLVREAKLYTEDLRLEVLATNLEDPGLRKSPRYKGLGLPDY